MRRTTVVTGVLLVILALAATPLLPAQEKPQPPPRTEEQSNAASPQQAKAAPKLGHPLDPADVDVLTGKNKQSARANRPVEVLPYGYAGYGGYLGYGRFASRWGGSRVGGSAQPLFAPIAFGRIGNRSFFVVGNTSSFSAPFFFFSGRRARHIGLFPAAGSRFSGRWR